MVPGGRRAPGTPTFDEGDTVEGGPRRLAPGGAALILRARGSMPGRRSCARRIFGAPAANARPEDTRSGLCPELQLQRDLPRLAQALDAAAVRQMPGSAVGSEGDEAWFGVAQDGPRRALARARAGSPSHPRPPSVVGGDWSGRSRGNMRAGDGVVGPRICGAWDGGGPLRTSRGRAEAQAAFGATDRVRRVAGPSWTRVR